jgi:hypothetical protein
MIGCFYRKLVSVTQKPLVIAIDVYNRCYKIIFVNGKVINPVLFAKSFPSIFEIADIVPMPNYSKLVDLVKPDMGFNRIDQCFFQLI